ncbi:MAG: AraC family ligand binding domain-containing protein, partial [Bacteroidota bacterium]
MKRGHRLYANDQLELLSMKATNQPFPEHFHETFCISLINEGVEVIELAHQTLHVSSGTISITNPYEIHANPILAAGTSLSFDTLYLSQEEADRILTQQGVRFANLQPSHPEQTNLFAKVKAQLTQPTAASLHSVLHPFLSSLLQVP